jgi:hypothetical protein
LLQTAADANRIPTPRGKTHPDAADVRAWMVKYGVGIDCSGFVSQALNTILPARPGPLLDWRLDQRGTPANQMVGGRGRFVRVASPSDLRPGDTMTPAGHPRVGHVRIVLNAGPSPEGGIEFRTAESSSAGDIGPTDATWRIPDPGSFARLQRDRRPPDPRRGRWKRAGGNDATPTFGRLREFADWQATHTPGGNPIPPRADATSGP